MMNLKHSLGLVGLVVGMQNCVCVGYEDKTPPPALQDVDGDGKRDAVYCNVSTAGDPRQYTYKVYFKRNLGEGKFGEPQLLMESNKKPTGYCN